MAGSGSDTYDAIVVGARCAGAPTAMLLARKGYRVLLVDRSTFPSDIMSTHYVQPPGVVRLQRWGLLDRLWDAGTPPIQTTTLYFGDVPFSPPRLADDIPPACCPRRIVLDKILVDAAVDAGAELREGFSVRELIRDGDRVAGIRGAAGDGATVSERARIVIGADGLHSVVARQVRPAEYHTKPTLTFGYYAYWSGVPLDGAEIYFTETAGMLLFPTNDNLACVAVGGPTEGFHEFRSDIEGNYRKVLELVPRVAERVLDGRREERFVGTNDQPNYFRRPHGPGWALVGDAGYHRDFITGLGITDAFRDAELLSDAIDASFAGGRPLEEALDGYEQRRNEIATPLYDLTCRLAGGEQPQPAEFLAFGAAMQAMLPAATA